MGYRGKLKEQQKARELRAAGMTLREIADALSVSKSSASLWARDVTFQPRLPLHNANYGARNRPPNKLARAKSEEIARLMRDGRERIGTLTDREFLVAGLALYAGEGAKGDGAVAFANSDPRMILFSCTWLRRFFDIDESRLRLRLYLHEELDLDAAVEFWTMLTGIPRSQFGKPYRAKADPTIRRTKHVMGCPAVAYSCARTHRAIMGLVHALLSSEAFPG